MRAPRPPTVPPTAPPIVAASETLLSPVFIGGAGVAVVEDADEEVELGIADVVIEAVVDVEAGADVGVGVKVDVDGDGVVFKVVESTTGTIGVSVITTVVTAAVGIAEPLNAAI